MATKSKQLLALLNERGPMSWESLLIWTDWTHYALKNTVTYLNKIGQILREGDIIRLNPNPPDKPPRKPYPEKQYGGDPEHAAWLAEVKRQIAKKQQRYAQENRL